MTPGAEAPWDMSTDDADAEEDMTALPRVARRQRTEYSSKTFMQLMWRQLNREHRISPQLFRNIVYDYGDMIGVHCANSEVVQIDGVVTATSNAVPVDDTSAGPQHVDIEMKPMPRFLKIVNENVHRHLPDSAQKAWVPLAKTFVR